MTCVALYFDFLRHLIGWKLKIHKYLDYLGCIPLVHKKDPTVTCTTKKFCLKEIAVASYEYHFLMKGMDKSFFLVVQVVLVGSFVYQRNAPLIREKTREIQSLTRQKRILCNTIYFGCIHILTSTILNTKNWNTQS